MKKACKKNPGILKVILFTALCILCLANTKVYAAAENNETTDSAPAAGGNVVYSTENGTWEKVNDSTFTMEPEQNLLLLLQRSILIRQISAMMVLKMETMRIILI